MFTLCSSVMNVDIISKVMYSNKYYKDLFFKLNIMEIYVQCANLGLLLSICR